MKDHLRAEGLDGPAAAQIAAHRTRDSKEQLPSEEALRQHKDLAAQYGNQAERVVAEARTQKHSQERGQSPESAARQGVSYARDHVFERTAVDSERTILTAAMDRSMGEATYRQVRQEFDRRVKTGEFRTVEHGTKHEGQQYTTAETLRMEREILAHTRKHTGRTGPEGELVWWRTAEEVRDRHPELNQGQRQAVEQVFRSPEQIVGLDGVAGAGKTTTLAVVREGDWPSVLVLIVVVALGSASSAPNPIGALDRICRLTKVIDVVQSCFMRRASAFGGRGHEDEIVSLFVRKLLFASFPASDGFQIVSWIPRLAPSALTQGLQDRRVVGGRKP